MYESDTDLNDILLSKVNETFRVIFTEKLREDIDDTLLQKFFSFLSSMGSECQDLLTYQLLINKTDVVKFLHKVLEECSSSEIQALAIRIVGLLSQDNGFIQILESQDSFSLLDDLKKFSRNEKISTVDAVVRAAFLECMYKCSLVEEGLKWIYKCGIHNTGLSCLSDRSLFVSRAAELFIVSCLVKSYHHGYGSSTETAKPSEERFCQLIEAVLQHITCPRENAITESQKGMLISCIAVLKGVFDRETEVLKLLNNKYKFDEFLIQNFLQPRLDVNVRCKLSELVALVLSTCPSKIPEFKAQLTHIVSTLVLQNQLQVLLCLVAAVLKCMPLGVTHLSTPLFYIMVSPLAYVGAFEVKTQPFHGIEFLVENVLREKTTCRKITMFCLNLLKSVQSNLQNSDILLSVKILQELVKLTVPKQDGSSSETRIIGCKKTKRALLETLASLINIEGILQKEEEISELLETCCKVMESCDITPAELSDCAKVIKSVFKIYSVTSQDVISKLCHKSNALDSVGRVLSKRIMDPRWEIVDTVLELLGDLVSIFTDYSLDSEWLLHHYLISFTWELVINSYLEGYVKASAIRTLGLMCCNNTVWCHLKAQNALTEEKVITTVIASAFIDQDGFVKRAMVETVGLLLTKDFGNMYSTCKSMVCWLLRTSCKDLDWEVKIRSLELWCHLVEKNLQSPVVSFENQLYCLYTHGLADCLVEALDDQDRAVRHHAATVLLNIRQNLEGCAVEVMNKSDLGKGDGKQNFSCTESTSNYPCSLGKESSIASQIIFDKDCRETAIETILDMDNISRLHVALVKQETSTQQHKLSHSLSQVKVHSSEVFQPRVSWQEFLKVIWADHVNSVLLETSKSTELYADNPSSLLDDILAAASCKAGTQEDDPEARDCY
ncbi:integrator complex assembly factor BRAT1 [Tachypleus tridentatus]|uniref:integrator complex assembly factor BRAT1 n=1 Tax=Tachypleus tridentatus TaxID=6853 RepID=UPI003FD27DA8